MDNEIQLITDNLAEISDKVGAYRAFAEMAFLLGVTAGIDDVRQNALELCARHFFSLPIQVARIHPAGPASGNAIAVCIRALSQRER